MLRRSSGGQHIVAAGEWRVTYNPGSLEIALPPDDLDDVREAMRRVVAALGCEVVAAADFDGAPAWDG